MHVPAAGERRVLAVDRKRPVGDRRVLERAPHERRRDHRVAVVSEADRAFVRELTHLGQLGALLSLRDRGQEPDLHLGLGVGLLDQRAEHRGRVDDRLRVRHREDRAVPACGRGGGAGGDRLLVFAAGSAEMNVRVDEGRREHEARAVEHAVAVDRQVRAELGDDAVVDPHVDLAVHALDGVERRGRRG